MDFILNRKSQKEGKVRGVFYEQKGGKSDVKTMILIKYMFTPPKDRSVELLHTRVL
jgi:hypothetical protein